MNTVRISLEELRAAATKRGPGYFEQAIECGRVEGTFLVIDCAEYERLFRKIRGLGDAVEIFAQPIASAIDAAFGTALSECPSCGERRDRLNGAVPFGP